MRFIELFAGIGGFRYGLERVCVENTQQSKMPPFGDKEGQCEQLPRECSERLYDCVWANEIDKYACQIYRKNFGEGNALCLGSQQGSNREENNIPQEGNSGDTKTTVWKPTGLHCGGWDGKSKLYEGDIRTVNTGEIPDHDLLVGGFPCQAFSIAGKRAGFEDTRGTLFFEIARILRDKTPRCILLENVKGLLSHDSGKTFQTILKVLSDIGYRVQWQVLNSKDFRVPQNRERVFIVGYLRGTGRRQVFPLGCQNKKSCIEVGTIEAINGNDILKRCYSTEGLSPVLNTCGGGNTEGKFAIPVLTLKKNQSTSTAIDSNYWKGIDNHGQRTMIHVKEKMRIRRLTPTECERLQGFPDGWTDGLSDTQRYKCLGNAVTTNVITAIGEKLCIL